MIDQALCLLCESFRQFAFVGWQIFQGGRKLFHEPYEFFLFRLISHRDRFDGLSNVGERVFRNEFVPTGKLEFTDVSRAASVRGEGYGMGAAVGDYDNDGDADLYVTNFGANVLYRNDGNGAFTDITATSGTGDSRWSTSAAFLDYDRDGDLDLFVTNYVDFATDKNVTCYGAGNIRDYCAPLAYNPQPDSLYRNEGDGRFTDVTASAGMESVFGSGLGIVCADFNHDGWVDIYVANDQRSNQMWINGTDGTFADRAPMAGAAYNHNGQPEASMGVTAGDFDGDGDEDLFMTHLSSQTNTLYVNDGKAIFIDATDRFDLGFVSRPFTGFGSEWFDYDNDGALDLFVANGRVTAQDRVVDGITYPFAEPDQLFHNQILDGGDRRKFRDVSESSGVTRGPIAVGRGAAFGDIDNDGDVDIVVTNNNGPSRLLLNDGGNRRHWISVRLHGVHANREGLGARVAVLRRDEPPLWRRVHRDGSYASANDVRVHFGLGETAFLEGIGVVWPDGGAEVWRSVAADSFVALRQGEGEPWVAGQ